MLYIGQHYARSIEIQNVLAVITENPHRKGMRRLHVESFLGIIVMYVGREDSGNKQDEVFGRFIPVLCLH